MADEKESTTDPGSEPSKEPDKGAAPLKEPEKDSTKLVAKDEGAQSKATAGEEASTAKSGEGAEASTAKAGAGAEASTAKAGAGAAGAAAKAAAAAKAGAAAGAAAKASGTAVAGAAAKAGHAAKVEEKKPPVPAVFGPFLSDHGIKSTRLDDHAGGCECIQLAADDLQSAMRLLRNSDETKLDYLVTVSGVDSKDDFESVYHLWSYENLNQLVVKVKIKKADVKGDDLPIVPSLSKAWPAANWHERETYDLVGIRFVGHPYPRRILNPWDWDGHPLRRDYIQPVDALNDKAKGSFR